MALAWSLPRECRNELQYPSRTLFLKLFGPIIANSIKSSTFAFPFEGTRYTVAGVLKLVDKPDLGSGAERRMGSIPFARTKIVEKQLWKRHHSLMSFRFIQNKSCNINKNNL